MSDIDENTQESQETEPQDTDASAGTSDAHDAANTEDSGQEPFDAERAKAKISKANNEAKNLRERLRQAESELTALKGDESPEKQQDEQPSEPESQPGPGVDERVAAAESRAMRLEVAMETGLTAKQAERLVGNSREELLSDANELLESFGSGPRTRTHSPSERTAVSRQGADLPEETDPMKLAAKIRRG